MQNREMAPFFDVLAATRPQETGAYTTEGFVRAKASCGGAVVNAENVAAKAERDDE